MENPAEIYRRLFEALRPLYSDAEARAVTLLVLDELFGWSQTDVYVGKVKSFSSEDARCFGQIMQRLTDGEPVQYVLGTAMFLGRKFNVRSGVLIPRPETEDLVSWVAEDFETAHAPRIVDCGTGSGCIAVSLKLLLPHAEVEGWDISPIALKVAQENAQKLGAAVSFVQKDMAALSVEADRFDAVVSNPPYVLDNEKASMEVHVLCHEPHEALFVPDNDPLLHYRHLAKSGLPLYLEINAVLADETCAMLKETAGYADVEIRQDRFGRPRMIRARKG